MASMTLIPEPLPGSLGSLENVVYYFDLYVHADSVLERAEYLVELSNAVDDLRSFHPGYDLDTGTMPWDREDNWEPSHA